MNAHTYFGFNTRRRLDLKEFYTGDKLEVAARRREVLSYVRWHVQETGQMPSGMEIYRGTPLSKPSYAYADFAALVRAGLIHDGRAE